MKRTQIYLDEEQDRRLAARASAQHRTKSDIIRQAVDALLDAPSPDVESLEEFRAATLDAAGIAPYLSSGQQYVEQLRGLDSTRLEESAGRALR